MNLHEWEKLLAEGERLCSELNGAGHNVKLRIYTTYDGRKGISFVVYDRRGNFHKEYFSGIGCPALMHGILIDNACRILDGE